MSSCICIRSRSLQISRFPGLSLCRVGRLLQTLTEGELAPAGGSSPTVLAAAPLALTASSLLVFCYQVEGKQFRMSLPQNVLLGHGDYFKLKAIKTQWTEEKTAASPSTARKKLERGPSPEGEPFPDNVLPERPVGVVGGICFSYCPVGHHLPAPPSAPMAYRPPRHAAFRAHIL